MEERELEDIIRSYEGLDPESFVSLNDVHILFRLDPKSIVCFFDWVRDAYDYRDLDIEFHPYLRYRDPMAVLNISPGSPNRVLVFIELLDNEYRIDVYLNKELPGGRGLGTYEEVREHMCEKSTRLVDRLSMTCPFGKCIRWVYFYRSPERDYPHCPKEWLR